MARNKVKKEKPPVRLLGTMFLLVLGLVAVYVGMALGIFTLVQRLVHLEDASYTLLGPSSSFRSAPSWAYCWPYSFSVGIWRRCHG